MLRNLLLYTGWRSEKTWTTRTYKMRALHKFNKENANLCLSTVIQPNNNSEKWQNQEGERSSRSFEQVFTFCCSRHCNNTRQTHLIILDKLIFLVYLSTTIWRAGVKVPYETACQKSASEELVKKIDSPHHFDHYNYNLLFFLILHARSRQFQITNHLMMQSAHSRKWGRCSHGCTQSKQFFTTCVTRKLQAGAHNS